MVTVCQPVYQDNANGRFSQRAALLRLCSTFYLTWVLAPCPPALWLLSFIEKEGLLARLSPILADSTKPSPLFAEFEHNANRHRLCNSHIYKQTFPPYILTTRRIALHFAESIGIVCAALKIRGFFAVS